MHPMHPLCLLLSIAAIVTASVIALFIGHLAISIKWIKRSDKCEGSSVFMIVFSFIGTLYFTVALLAVVAGGLLMFHSKDFSRMKMTLVVKLAASLVFKISESIILLIGIAAGLNVHCLKEETKSNFVGSWVLIFIPTIIYDALLAALVFESSITSTARRASSTKSNKYEETNTYEEIDRYEEID
ncbi:hypothetical protein OESDEN_09559 [Oesophagostomum dentatum]|uniref:Serpentine receptor class gamma n=1 Tax=Oesophagostomum dentatum TaxID=61180 RepID=A0A0B1T5E7_OESDE|nr:hypothetical protein OESDEN_09559 [Oesophagostomum dentatum]